MALHAIDQTGMLYWHCHNPRSDCKLNSVHIGSEDVQWTTSTEVGLPTCPVCGERRMLKIVYTNEELQPDNMITYGMVPVDRTLPHALTGEPVPVRIPELMPIGANAYHERNKELARQLHAIGKLPPT